MTRFWLLTDELAVLFTAVGFTDPIQWILKGLSRGVVEVGPFFQLPTPEIDWSHTSEVSLVVCSRSFTSSVTLQSEVINSF
jgi:hypothetical protein